MNTKEDFIFGDSSDVDLEDSEEISITESPVIQSKKTSTRASSVKKAAQTIIPEQTLMNTTSTASATSISRAATSEPNKIYTVKQAADYLQLSSKTILRKINLGELIAFIVGRTWRIKQSQIDDYLNNNISNSNKTNP